MNVYSFRIHLDHTINNYYYFYISEEMTIRKLRFTHHPNSQNLGLTPSFNVMNDGTAPRHIHMCCRRIFMK